jgi:hypothetical protein
MVDIVSKEHLRHQVVVRNTFLHIVGLVIGKLTGVSGVKNF